MNQSIIIIALVVVFIGVIGFVYYQNNLPLAELTDTDPVPSYQSFEHAKPMR